MSLGCLVSPFGTWAYFVSGLPSLVATVIFIVLLLTHWKSLRRLGAVAYLVPLEVLRNGSLAVNEFYWYSYWTDLYCRDPSNVGLIEISLWPKLMIGLTAAICILIYVEMRRGK